MHSLLKKSLMPWPPIYLKDAWVNQLMQTLPRMRILQTKQNKARERQETRPKEDKSRENAGNKEMNARGHSEIAKRFAAEEV